MVGWGLGIKILYDEVPPGIDALDPENRLIFATGPLNGTVAPGSGTYCLISKSPLTGFIASAQANGFLEPDLSMQVLMLSSFKEHRIDPYIFGYIMEMLK